MDLSIVIPTYDEPAIGRLLEDIDEIAQSMDAACEVIVVDDTPGRGTVDAVASAKVRCDVRVIYRPGSSRGPWGGLSGAVLDGVGAASAERVLVMDGDGQHPPGVVPALMTALGSADLAIASRYCRAGRAAGLAGGYRRVVSSASTALARRMFPTRVGCRTTDPMTGFFALHRDAVDLSAVADYAIGFKVLLAVLVTHPRLRIVEVPFVFGVRHAGESKAGWRNGAAFLRQVAMMRVAS